MKVLYLIIGLHYFRNYIARHTPYLFKGLTGKRKAYH